MQPPAMLILQTAVSQKFRPQLSAGLTPIPLCPMLSCAYPKLWGDLPGRKERTPRKPMGALSLSPLSLSLSLSLFHPHPSHSLPLPLQYNCPIFPGSQPFYNFQKFPLHSILRSLNPSFPVAATTGQVKGIPRPGSCPSS